jgi:hypothetical protein
MKIFVCEKMRICKKSESNGVSEGCLRCVEAKKKVFLLRHFSELDMCCAGVTRGSDNDVSDTDTPNPRSIFASYPLPKSSCVAFLYQHFSERL